MLDEGADAWRIVGKLPNERAYGSALSTRFGVALLGGSDAARHGAIALVQEAAAPDRDAEYSP